MTRPTPPPAAGIQDAARYLAETRTGEAVAVLERLVADYPAYVTAHVLLAKAYEASGQPNGALEAWHRAYFLMPGSPLIVRERTRLLRNVSGVEDAVASSDPNVALEEEEMPVASHAAEPVAEAEPDAPFDDAEADLDEEDDLDSLIAQIENAPRIRPDASFKDDTVEEEDDDDELVSETLARIYESQKQYNAAAHAYEQLAEQNPERATDLLSKAAELRRLAAGNGA